MRIPKRPPPFGEVLHRVVMDDPKFLGESHEAPIRDLVARADDEGWNWENRKRVARYFAPNGAYRFARTRETWPLA